MKWKLIYPFWRKLERQTKFNLPPHGPIVFAAAVWRGDTALPRWMALTSPVALVLIAVLLGAPTPIGRALLVPAAPNLAHVWFFALAALALAGREVPAA